MFSSLFLILMITPIVLPVRQLSQCLSGHKSCAGIPSHCIGQQCMYMFSTRLVDLPRGFKKVEIEIFGERIKNHDWIGIGYTHTKMENEVILFCGRDDADLHGITGVEIVQSQNHEMIHYSSETVNIQEKTGWNVELMEFEVEGDYLYCRVRHSIEPLSDIFNTPQLDILMAKGKMIDESLEYYSKTVDVGHVDLSKDLNHRKIPKNSCSTNALFVIAIIYFMAHIVDN